MIHVPLSLSLDQYQEIQYTLPESSPEEVFVFLCWGSPSVLDACVEALLHKLKVTSRAHKNKKNALSVRRFLLLTAVWYEAAIRRGFLSTTAPDQPPRVMLMREIDLSHDQSHLGQKMMLASQRISRVYRGMYRDLWQALQPTAKECQTEVNQLTQTLANCSLTCHLADSSADKTQTMVRIRAELPYAVFPNNMGLGDVYYSHPLWPSPDQRALWFMHRQDLPESLRPCWWSLQFHWLGLLPFRGTPESQRDVTVLQEQERYDPGFDAAYLRRLGFLYDDKLMYKVPANWDLWRFTREGPAVEEVDRSLLGMRLVALRQDTPLSHADLKPLKIPRSTLPWLKSHMRHCAANIIGFCSPRLQKKTPYKWQPVTRPHPEAFKDGVHTEEATQATVLRLHQPRAKNRNPVQGALKTWIDYMKQTLFNRPSVSERVRQIRALLPAQPKIHPSSLEGVQVVMLQWGLFLTRGQVQWSGLIDVGSLGDWWRGQEDLVVAYIQDQPLQAWHNMQSGQPPPPLDTSTPELHTPELRAQLRSSVLQQSHATLINALVSHGNVDPTVEVLDSLFTWLFLPHSKDP